MAVIRCEDVMSRSPRTCKPGDTLLDAIRMMKEIDVGFVPICAVSDNRLVGVLTDRDVALSLAKDVKPSQIRIQDVMSRDPVSCRPNDDIMACAVAMEQNQCRRVPVVDENNMLLGVISTDIEIELPAIIEAISLPYNRR
jgi:CBS domain-containing protein